MKYFFTLIAVCIFSINAWAQPANDDCPPTSLGLAPVCDGDIFTNVDATTTNIGFGNNPACFNGGTTQRDVFFSFEVDPAFLNLTITVTGSDMGPNAMSIVNPQIALYRGSCVDNGLAELLCVSSDVGDTETSLDAIGLTPGLTYYIRINDFSASATPNWGDFQVCIEEYVPEINMGEEEETTACFGTLFDSGGPDDEYTNGENHTFTVCPLEFTQCIAIDVVDFNIMDGDVLNIYAGNDITAPSIVALSGVSSGNDFEVMAASTCVTFQFVSDGFNTSSGFELTWQCSPSACDASTFTNPTPISGLPVVEGGLSTCGAGATINDTPCGVVPFLNGPEMVFAYTVEEGGYCASVAVTDAEPGTGVMVLNGLPDDPETICLNEEEDGVITIVNFDTPGTYYIVVANPTGCTDFGLQIQEVDCALSPALVDALCNPLNGCNVDGVDEFVFEDGFQDIPLNQGQNNGCWFGVGAEPDFYWFTIQAQADGPFGFILESADVPSDIDFNVWGPFTPEQACETPEVIIDAVTFTQPIRSSYDGGADPTGLADEYTYPGDTDPTIVNDVYDCDGDGTSPDIVQTIPAQEGEVYVVLVNDWGNQIEEGGILVDWTPSDPEVLEAVGATVAANDTSVCANQAVLLEVIASAPEIEWIGPYVDELSCTDCFNPTATPPETRVYQAVIDAICYIDTIDVTVNVFDLDAGPDLTFCLNEEFSIPAGQDFSTATYEWNPPAGLEFSCTDCPTPSVIAQTPGTYDVPVSLTAEACNFMDMIQITVLDVPAPQYSVAPESQICIGDAISIGGPAMGSHTYEWTSNQDMGVLSNDANPEVTPNGTTTYYLSVSNTQCPQPSIDSVIVNVAQYPVVEVLDAMDTLCRGDIIQLGNTVVEDDVTYTWTGPGMIANPDSVYTEITAEVSGNYTLVGDRLGCETQDDEFIEVVEVGLNLNQPDSTLLCLGETVTLAPDILPTDATIQWNQAEVTENNPTLAPQHPTTYIATVSNAHCVRMDTFHVQVDSIPLNMSVSADPEKEIYCQGDLIQLVSPLYEPADFPNIQHVWTETIGEETSDSLYNLVITAAESFIYVRHTESGACMNTDTIAIQVQPIVDIQIEPANPLTCQGNPIDLSITNGDDLENIEWSPAGGLSCTDCLNPTATLNQTQTYTVTAEINGCPTQGSVTIDVDQDQLPLDISPQDGEICVGESIDLSITTGGELTNIDWNNSATLSCENCVTTTASPEQTTTYTVTANLNGCPAVGTTTVTVTDLLYTAMIETVPSPLGVLFEEESFTLNAVVDPPTGFDYTYTWTGDGVQMTDMQSTEVIAPNVIDSTNFEYTLLVSAPEGCEQTVSVNVTVKPAGYAVPNVFSPNGDDKNEVFKLYTNNAPADFSMTVFNRWGQVVFETSDPNEAWDGNVDGDPAPSDIYIYKITTSSDLPADLLEGQVTLIR